MPSVRAWRLPFASSPLGVIQMDVTRRRKVAKNTSTNIRVEFGKMTANRRDLGKNATLCDATFFAAISGVLSGHGCEWLNEFLDDRIK